MKKTVLFHFPSGKWRKKLLLMKLYILFIMCSCGTLMASPSFPQQVRLDVSFNNETLKRVLEDIRHQTGNQLVFVVEEVSGKNRVTISRKDATLEEILDAILPQNNLAYTIKDDVVMIFRQDAPQPPNVKTITITGRVTDEKGNPLSGASVLINQTNRGTVTDINGRYKIQAREDDVLKFSVLGYKDEIVPIKGKTVINATLNPAVKKIEEVVVMAFGEGKKESVVSSITMVKPMDLKTSNSDLTSSFAGKIAGIIGWQTGGTPGALTEEEMNSKFYIRGITSFQTNANIDPLILLDGVETSKLDLARVSPEDIESFAVLKDASATAMYGARGANGVILVTTKKGQEGSVYATVRYEAIVSMPTSEIDVVDPVTYMKMYNEALVGRSPLATPKYSVEQINRTASGKYPSWVYPANDWYDILFKDFSINHHFGVNIQGGSKVIQYYASVNHNQDQGMIKTDKLNDFDCNITNSQTSFRVNLNINLKAGITLLLNSSTTLDRYHGPVSNQKLRDKQGNNLSVMAQAYYYAFNASPVDFAPTYPGDDTYGWPHLRFGTTSAQQMNPYEVVHMGYLQRDRYSTINKAEYIHNLSSLIKGLEFRASVSIVQSGLAATAFITVPYKYSLVSYDFETGEHKLQLENAQNNPRRTLEVDKMNQYGTGTSTDTRFTYEARMLHTAAWADHQTSLTAVFQAQDRRYTPIASVLNGMPYRNLTFSMRGTYGFKNRYFAEASFGYNGSERFAEKNRMGFFPAVGAAWVVSNESFMKSVSNWLDFLKLRASWGKVGNDGIIDQPRFVFLPNIEVQSIMRPVIYGQVQDRYIVASYANENIQWEIAETVNLGLETRFFKGALELTADAYQEIRHNIISYRTTIPATMGIEYPQLDNVGKARSRGVDLAGKFQYFFNREKDFWVILNGTLTYNKTVYLEIEEAADTPEWQRKNGREISQQMGYIAEGLFRDQAEIDNSPLQGGDVQPGDIRYRDINGDGKIDVNDAVYIGFPETPRLIYGFSGFINYRNFEFSFAFQGSGKRSFFMDPEALSPFVDDHAMLTAIYEDHWSEDNMSNMPFWPRLSTYNITQHNPQEDWYNANNKEIRKSTYFMRECSFLRCTSLELAYNLPERLMKRWRLQNVRFYVTANNPFIISNFDIWDVELGEDGFNYPIQKTYAIGLKFSF